MRFLPRSRGGVLWRALLACLLVVGFTAGTTAVAGLLQVKNIVNIIDVHKAIASKGLVPPAPGQPETLLLVGVDHRYGQGSGPGQTDTMMLVRINDQSSTINMLSIPRDLGVDIPGYGFSKINAAYEDGGKNGSTLLLDTLKQDLFPGLQVTHLLVVGFSDFAKLITSFGCVYADVDHRYYNYNVGTLATNFSNIDIEPGYQQLCGNPNSLGKNSALAFVRFRHNDSDLVRESRQQDFLRWAKSQFTSHELLSESSKLENEFADYVQSDKTLHSTDGLIDLFNLAWNADGSSIKSIPFPDVANASGPIGDYLSFSEPAAEGAYAEFMRATPLVSTAPQKSTSGGKRKRKRPYRVPSTMVDESAAGKEQAGELGDAGLPIYYPADLPDNYTYCFTLTGDCNEAANPDTAYANSYPRRYTIRADGTNYPSYVMTLVLGNGNYTEMDTGEYFTVQGTTWKDPPILRDPVVKVVNGRTLDLYWQGGQLTMVAWRTKQAVYWISNTLQNDIPTPEMLGMAATFARSSG